MIRNKANTGFLVESFHSVLDWGLLCVICNENKIKVSLLTSGHVIHSWSRTSLTEQLVLKNTNVIFISNYRFVQRQVSKNTLCCVTRFSDWTLIVIPMNEFLNPYRSNHWGCRALQPVHCRICSTCSGHSNISCHSSSSKGRCHLPPEYGCFLN